METEDEFLFDFFNFLSELAYDKAKEITEKEKPPKSPVTSKMLFLNLLNQLALAEKTYMDAGFLQNKQKSFLRKDNSLKAVYDNMRSDLRKIEDGCKGTQQQNYCQNITQFLNARINLIDLYEKIYNQALTNKHMSYVEILNIIETIMQTHIMGFTNISLTPIKAVFSLECDVLKQLFRALLELQKLQFLPSLALIHGAHTQLLAWEGKMQREPRKVGLFKNNSNVAPALFYWLQKLKGAVLSKFSLYFHDILANQTTPTEMRLFCSKLNQDYYQKMVTFQRKHEASCVILLSDNQASCETADYDSFPIIVSYPPRSPPQLDTMLKMISETNSFLNMKPIIKFYSQVSFSVSIDWLVEIIFVGSVYLLLDNGGTEHLLCDSFRVQKVGKRYVDYAFY